jgi:ABC-type multidrug transport system fused ATPase/permease subunit
VTFGYAPNLPPVFKDLNFTIPPGKRTAFIAAMGQGKTTFFRLVLRFHDPQGGEILVGGKPSTAFTQNSIRQQVAMMSQFPAFFHASFRENMLIAKPSATDEELTALCVQTGMMDVMKAKGLTLDTPLAGGQILSGGQKKLLALTRCLLRNPSILFLDEPTAGVDNLEKFKLLDMLCRATEGKTVVVVDHDVNWLLQFCDYFISMDQGRVAEQGGLEQVLRARGLINNLYAVAQGPKTREISRYVTEA